MPRTKALITVCFCAGMLGALCSSLVAWKSGQMGLPAMAGVRMTPALTTDWIYSRLVWGGLWGLAYFLAVGPLKSRRHWARKGLWFSLLPSLIAIFYLYPYVYHKGMAGFDLGMLTPLLIMVSNLVWGFFTGFFARLFWGR